MTSVVVHCLRCDEDPQERWHAAVAQLTYPPVPGYPQGRYDTYPACDLCLFDAVNASIRDGYPITINPLETAT